MVKGEGNAEGYRMEIPKLGKAVEFWVYRSRRSMHRASEKFGGIHESKNVVARTYHDTATFPTIVVFLYRRRGRLPLSDVIHESSHVADRLLIGTKPKNRGEARAQLVEQVSGWILRKAA